MSRIFHFEGTLVRTAFIALAVIVGVIVGVFSASSPADAQGQGLQALTETVAALTATVDALTTTVGLLDTDLTTLANDVGALDVGPVMSEAVAFLRLASEGEGSQTVVMALEPTTLFVSCRGSAAGNGGDFIFGSWGFTADDRLSMGIQQRNSGLISREIDRLVQLTDGTNSTQARLVDFLPGGGFTLLWTPTNQGIDARCVAIGLR